MMAFVFRPKRRVNGKLHVSRTYTAQFRLAGHFKVRRVPLGVTDKQVAEEKLRQIIRDAEREVAGLSTPKACQEAASRKLKKHLEEFIADRFSVGRNVKFGRELKNKLLRLIDTCGWVTPSQVTTE